jgi:hypothetical protein
MKKTKMTATLVLVLVLLFCLIRTSEGKKPVGSEFTYHGRLARSGGPANGPHDFQCKLFDDPCEVVDTNQVGPTLDINDLDVHGGQFHLDLDFGSDPNIFNGEMRWLEIAVRQGDSNDPCDFTVLEPRVKLNAAPYAVNAGRISGRKVVKTEHLNDRAVDPNKIAQRAVKKEHIENQAVGRNKIEDGAVDPNKIDHKAVKKEHIEDRAVGRNKIDDHAVDANKIEDGAVTSIKIADSSILFSDIAQNGAVAGQVMKWNGSSWVVANDLTGASGWTVSGDNVYSSVSGNVGIGTTNPTAKLTINGAILRDGSTMYGADVNTHVNLGTESTTGKPGPSYRYATVSGGLQNEASHMYATVGGGENNIAGGQHATISGGHNNIAGLYASTVSGGGNNNATAYIATVGGGHDNNAMDDGATVSGGSDNNAGGRWATVPGGWQNYAGGDYSFAAGYRAKANHHGSFVWADSTDMDFTSTEPNQFLIRASGGVGIGTSNTNEKLTVGGVLSISEIPGPWPSPSFGYGKLFVKSTDGKLYFKHESGIEYDLAAYAGNCTAGDYFVFANDTERSTVSTSYVLLKQIRIRRGGTLRIKYEFRINGGLGGLVYTNVRRNGVPVGPERSTTSTTYVPVSLDIPGWSAHDFVEIWGRTADILYMMSVRNFRLHAGNAGEASSTPGY